jgi:hypothetical protein
MKNKLYKIATSISGEELEDGLVKSGAKNDYYYDECKIQKEKLNQIKAMAENVIEVSIHKEEAIKIMNYLESDFEDQSEHYFALENLLDK